VFKKNPITTDLDEGSHVVELLHEDGHLLVDAGWVMVGCEVEASVEHHRWSHERGWVRFRLLVINKNYYECFLVMKS